MRTPEQENNNGTATSVFIRRRAPSSFDDVLLLHAVDVELRRARDDLVERLVEIERRRLGKPREIHARDDERLEVRARQPPRFQLLDGRRHMVVELENLAAAPLALLHRLADRSIEEFVD